MTEHQRQRMQSALLSPSNLFQALTPTLAVRSSHKPNLLRLKGRVKAWEGTDKVPAAADPCPAPGTATLGKPQLWAEGTCSKSIVGTEQVQRCTIAFRCWWSDWYGGEHQGVAVLSVSGLVLWGR